MDATEIVEAIKSIPEKKENLREAFETLQSSFAAATSSSPTLLPQWKWKWKDVERHISSIETSILDRFNAAIQQTTTATATTEDDDGGGGDDDDGGGGGDGGINNNNKKKKKKKNSNLPKPELLKSVCINMDAKGLQSCISSNCNNSALLAAMRDDLSLALRSSAPDPALLILDVMDGFHPPPRNPRIHRITRARKRELLTARKTCIYLLEILYPISLEVGIKPSVRERALSLAVEWKAKIAENKAKIAENNDESWGTSLQALGLLRLIAAYGLVAEFEADDIMEQLCFYVSKKWMTADLVKSLGLADKVHDLVRRLNGKGRQLIAVKIVYALNMVDKFPPVPLLKAYITESKQRANELRKKGNNSVQAQKDAIYKEMGSLMSVLKAIEEYKLESEYPRDRLFKRIAQLRKKLAASSLVASNSKTQQKRQSNKRPRLSPATSLPATSAPVIAASSYHQLIQPHPQCGRAERAPYIGDAGPYGLVATGIVYNHSTPSLYSGRATTGSVYNHGCPSVSCITTDQVATHSQPRYYYPSDSLASTSSLYDRLVTYHGHHLDGQPSSYGYSLYP